MAAEPAARPRGHRLTWTAILAMALLAAALQAVRLSRPGGLLSGGEYDTSYELANAIALLHGGVPYRDFVVAEPGGLVLLMTPFAALSHLAGGRGALIAVTAWTPIVAALDVLLLGLLLRHRGWVAVLLGCGLLAVYPAVYDALMEGQLEPLMTLLSLLGLTLVLRDGRPVRNRARLALGGAALGLATSVLVTAAIPMVLVAVACARPVRRRLLPYLGGAVAALAAVNVPFLALAPSAFVNDIAVSQLQRTGGAARTPLMMRLIWMTFGGGDTGAVVAACLLAALLLLALVVVVRRPSALGWVALGSAVLLLAAQLAIATYYGHFAAMSAPYLALLLGLCAAPLASRRRPRRLALTAATAAAVAIAVTLVGSFQQAAWRDPRAYIDGAIPEGACVFARYTQFALAADRLRLEYPGCATLMDTIGTERVYAHDPSEAERVVAEVVSQSDYLLLNSTADEWLPAPWAAPVRAYIASHFVLIRSGRISPIEPFDIYRRVGIQAAGS